jgi:hypothetical protein
MLQRIRVLENYGGSQTNERRILPGEYEVGDPALFGLEDYLVNNQRKAVYVEVPVIDWPDDGLTDEDLTEEANEAIQALGAEDADYERQTIDDLRAEIERRGIDLDGFEGTGANGRLIKADLVNILEGDDRDHAHSEG